MNASISGVILCGGLSSRMGRPKAHLPWRGQPLIAWMVSSLSRFLDDIVVVSSAGLELPELAARVVVDRTANLGPLGGIREALHAVRYEAAFITRIDAPNVDGSVIDALSAASPTGAFEVNGWIEPFPALYARQLGSLADTLLSQGRRRPLHLLEAGGFQRLDGAPWAATGIFDNFNTPAEYLRAVRTVEEQPTVTVLFSGSAETAAGTSRMTTGIGTLREVLRALEPQLRLVEGAEIASHFELILGTQPVTNLELPLGPGEQLLVRDAPKMQAI